MTSFTEGTSVRVPGGHVGVITKVDHKQRPPYHVTFDINKIGEPRPFTLLYKSEEMTRVSGLGE